MFKETEYYELKSKLSIDIMALDDELMQHPMLIQDVNEYAARALNIRDTRKIGVELATAEAGWRLRVPEKDLKMPSEAKISSLIPLDKNLQEAQAAYELAKFHYNYWSGLAEAYREKGGSLKRVSELTIAGFIAPNKVRRAELAEERRNRSE